MCQSIPTTVVTLTTNLIIVIASNNNTLTNPGHYMLKYTYKILPNPWSKLIYVISPLELLARPHPPPAPPLARAPVRVVPRERWEDRG
jgi:hypothetical protein